MFGIRHIYLIKFNIYVFLTYIYTYRCTYTMCQRLWKLIKVNVELSCRTVVHMVNLIKPVVFFLTLVLFLVKTQDLSMVHTVLFSA